MLLGIEKEGDANNKNFESIGICWDFGHTAANINTINLNKIPPSNFLRKESLVRKVVVGGVRFYCCKKDF